MINRQIFAQTAEEKVKTVVYKQMDCQSFVEYCAAKAGYKFNARGTNDIWRNYLAAKGSTASFPLAVGDCVLKWRAESAKLPERYRGDGNGDFYHIGIITCLNPITVCHSANSTENGKKDTFTSIADLAKVWSHCGILKNTATAVETPASSSLDEAIAHLEAAEKILKNLGQK